MPGTAEREILETTTRVLGRITGMEVSFRDAEGRPDAEITIRHGDLQLDFTAQIKGNLTRPAAAMAVEQLARFKTRPLLVAKYINPRLADLLRKAGLSFADTAGNAYIDEPPLFILVKGNKPEHHQKPEKPSGRVFRTKGLQVVFALLCNPGLENEPFRKITAFGRVALGSVDWIMKELVAMDFLRNLGRGRRRLVRKEALLRRWVETYPEQLGGKILKGRYSPKDPDWWQNANIREDGGLWGGEVAAAKLTVYLKPAAARVYMEEAPGKMLVKNKLSKSPEGSVEVLDKFWGFEFDWQHGDLVPPLLIYADLMATGDARNIETAGIIYEEHLARLVRED